MGSKRLLTLTLCTLLISALALPTGIANASGGLLWAERTVPDLDGDIRAMDFPSSGATGYALEYDSGRNGLWVTKNGGDTWMRRTIWPTGEFYPLGDSFEINDISFSRVYPSRGWAVGVFADWKSSIWTEYSPFILFTDDGGLTWSNQTGNIDTDLTGDGALLSVEWVIGGEAYACGENGTALATDDYGDQSDEWEAVAYNNPALTFNDVGWNYVTGAKRMICVGDSGAVYYFDYTTATSTWSGATNASAATGGLDFRSVVVPDTDYDRVVAVGEHGLFAWSNDVADTWTVDNTGGDELWFDAVVDLYNIGHVYASGNLGNAVRFSYNSGPQTWTEGTTGLTGTLGHMRAIASVNSGELWAGGDSGLVMQRAFSSTTRASGTDRYKTAIALSETWEDDSVDAVVIATGLDFPDALSASGLAGALECPLLLAGPELTSEVEDEIARLDPDDIYIIGGWNAVSGLFQDQLSNALNIGITRIAGSNRYHTSRLVAEKIDELEGADFSQKAFIARGDSFADALAVSPFAYSQKIPVLLTATSALSADTAVALGSLDIEDAVVVGGTGAVSDIAKDAATVITLANGGSTTVRWSGTNRYATAATVARSGMLAGWGTPAFVGLATGLNFPDALGGGPVCGAAGGVMLLTDGTSLSAPAGTFLDDYSGDIVEVQVFGGPGVVSEAVKDAADAKIY